MPAERVITSDDGLVVAPRFGPARSWTEATIVDALREFRRTRGRAPVKRDLTKANGLPHGNIIRSRFGSYAAALDAAGVRPLKKQQRWTRDEILHRFAQWKERTGQAPTAADSRNDRRLPNLNTVARHFGSWNEAMVAAGFPPRQGGRLGSKWRPPITEASDQARNLQLRDDRPLSVMADMLAAVARVQIADAEDALQEAWIELARREQPHPEPLGFLFECAKVKARSGAYRARRQVAFDESSVPTFDPEDQLEARLALREFFDRRRHDILGDDVLHTVADSERAALGLYEPIAQRRDMAWLDKLPGGKWLEKLRAAHSEGRIPCVCWDHVRQLGITPPVEVARHFPTCMGEAPGRLRRRPEPRPMSKVVEAFLGELDARANPKVPSGLAVA